MSTNNPNMIDDLLVKWLAGEATAEEIASVQNWINTDEKNRTYFNHFKLIWEGSEAAVAESTITEDAAWQRLSARLKTAPKSATKVHSLNYWVKIAAVFLIFGAAAFYLFRQYQYQSNLLVELKSSDKVVTDTLPDGSVITLNKNTSISYQNEFKGKSRELRLNGEAFFSIEPDRNKPFVISVNDLKVTVVGTSFNIKSRNDNVAIVVETGIVKVESDRETIQLKAGEKVEIDQRDGDLVKENSDNQLYNFYRTKEFVCDTTPLSELIPVLNEVYGVEIKIADPKLKTLTLTTVFKDQPVEQILGVIAQTFNIQMEQQGRVFILK